jgi:2-polyprenyl-6-methoxyphenol hydroxylase-like FAD-dependent oxidoreductase
MTSDRTSGERSDVAIVGAGPTGLTLAILLAQRGHTVTVLERWAEPYPLPRAVHFDHEVGRLLQACGIGDDLRAISEPADIYEWRNATGDTLLRFGRQGDGPSGWPASSMFCQPELEGLLERRVAELAGIELRRGVEVTAVDDRGDHAVVSGADGATVRATFVVGCDGANSTVRSLLGLPVHDLGFFYDWLIVDVILDEPRVFDPLNLQVCDPARPTTAVSGGPGRRRWEFMKLPGRVARGTQRRRRAWELLAPWDVHPGNARLERHAVYTFQARYAEQWRSGGSSWPATPRTRCRRSPDRGMCAGVRDAGNLAWKLDLVLAGQASEALLDATRGAPRARQGSHRVLDGARQGDLRPRPRRGRGTRRRHVGGGRPRTGRGPRSARSHVRTRASRVAPRREPVRPGSGRRAAVRRRPRRRLAARVVRSRRRRRLGARGDLVEWFDAIGGTVIPVDATDPVFGRWFGEHDARWALQRPDFYVYGTATDAAGAARLLADLRSQLLDPSPEGTST